VDVLERMVRAVRPGGHVLDLQVIRPDPTAETDGRVICEIDGTALFRKADAALATVEALVAAGRLVEEAVDDHDVLKHYADGPALADDWVRSDRRPVGDGAARLTAVAGPCVTRERCRLRRLRVVG
jgi:hypothetical protein